MTYSKESYFDFGLNIDYLPLLILAFQLILLPILARFALTSVRKFRQAEE